MSEFLETFVSYSFEPLINSPTRITETSKSLIDNICVKSTCDNLSGAIVCDISDYFPVFSFFNFPFKLKNKATYVDKRIINVDSIRTFLVKLDEVDFDTMFGLDALTSKDPNDVYDIFVNIVLYTSIYTMYDFHIRKFVLSKIKMSGFTLHYKKCIRRIFFLYRKYLKNPTEYRKNVYVAYKK